MQQAEREIWKTEDAQDGVVCSAKEAYRHEVQRSWAVERKGNEWQNEVKQHLRKTRGIQPLIAMSGYKWEGQETCKEKRKVREYMRRDKRFKG